MMRTLLIHYWKRTVQSPSESFSSGSLGFRLSQGTGKFSDQMRSKKANGKGSKRKSENESALLMTMPQHSTCSNQPSDNLRSPKTSETQSQVIPKPFNHTFWFRRLFFKNAWLVDRGEHPTEVAITVADCTQPRVIRRMIIKLSSQMCQHRCSDSAECSWLWVEI